MEEGQFVEYMMKSTGLPEKVAKGIWIQSEKQTVGGRLVARVEVGRFGQVHSSRQIQIHQMPVTVTGSVTTPPNPDPQGQNQSAQIQPPSNPDPQGQNQSATEAQQSDDDEQPVHSQGLDKLD